MLYSPSIHPIWPINCWWVCENFPDSQKFSPTIPVFWLYVFLPLYLVGGGASSVQRVWESLLLILGHQDQMVICFGLVVLVVPVLYLAVLWWEHAGIRFLPISWFMSLNSERSPGIFCFCLFVCGSWEGTQSSHVHNRCLPLKYFPGPYFKSILLVVYTFQIIASW